jgi:hypothetical protein
VKIIFLDVLTPLRNNFADTFILEPIKMRILIVSTFFPPLNSIASHRPYSWARYWTLAGHDVTVLTTEKQEDPHVGLAVDNPGYKVIEVPSPRFLSKLKSGYQEASGGTTFEGESKETLIQGVSSLAKPVWNFQCLPYAGLYRFMDWPSD